MVKIRKGIWETSSSSASALAMLSNGVKHVPKLDKTFKCVQGVYDTACDGRPHIYLYNWMDKMALLADDTELWHRMFKKATGHDFELWTAVQADSELVKKIDQSGFAFEKYPEPYVASRFVQTSENSFSRTESIYLEPEWKYLCGYDIDYYVDDGVILVKHQDLDKLFEMFQRYPLPRFSFDTSWTPYDIIADETLLEEVIFNPGIAINIGGDAYWNDTQTVPVIGSADDVPIERRGFCNISNLYQNGTEQVLLAMDGTKIRIAKEGSEPYYPESIDLKITDNCDIGCPFCYENCRPNGKHGTLAECLKGLPEFVELAVGGGNPLSHPEYEKFITLTKYVNTTMHAREFARLFDLSQYETDEWDFSYNIFPKMPIANCCALGISVTTKEDAEITASIFDKLVEDPNTSLEDPYKRNSYIGNQDLYTGGYGHGKGVDTVIHVINGIVTEEILKPLYGRNLNLLVLGYKHKGRGIQYADNDSIKENQQWLYDNINSVAKHFKTVAFDTLALEQLEMERWLTKEQWDAYFMGDDGLHSMYIDLVTQTYGISSTDDRRWPLTDNIHDMFMHVREVVKQDCKPVLATNIFV